MSGCIFCSIVRGEVPGTKIYEDDETLAIMDIKPITPGHVIVIPKKHTEFLTELNDNLAGHVMTTAKKIALYLKKSQLNSKGINYILADGSEAGQEVFHVHMHVVPRSRGDGFSFHMPAKYNSETSREDLEKIAIKIRKGAEKVGDVF